MLELITFSEPIDFERLIKSAEVLTSVKVLELIEDAALINETCEAVSLELYAVLEPVEVTETDSSFELNVLLESFDEASVELADCVEVKELITPDRKATSTVESEFEDLMFDEILKVDSEFELAEVVGGFV